MTEDRLLRAIRAIVREVFPRYDFLGKHRYRVFTMAGGRVNLQAVRKRAGLPDLLPVSIVSGVPGVTAELKPGAVVLVEFIEGDPQYPIVTGFSQDDGDTFVPVSLTVDARELVRIGVQADAVELGEAASAVICEGNQISITPGTSGGAVTGTITITGPKSKVKA